METSKQNLFSDPDPVVTSIDILEANPDLVPEFKKYKAQIGTKFGCILLALIHVYKKDLLKPGILGSYCS